MPTLTREDVIGALGRVDDLTIAEIIETGATREELAEAQTWIANDELLLASGRAHPAGSGGWWISWCRCRRTMRRCWSAARGSSSASSSPGLTAWAQA